MPISSLNASVRDVAAEKVEHRINLNPAATREFFLPNRLKNKEGLSNPYRQHGMTYAASRAIATNIAQVPFLIHAGASEEDEDIIRDGPWVELFDRPNPVMSSRSQFWETTLLQMLERGGMSVWVKEGAGDERIGDTAVPTELWPISGRLFEPMLDPETKLPVAWLYKAPGEAKPIVYAPHELVIHRMTDPHNALGGIGAYEPAQLAQVQDYKAAKYNEAFFDNDATPGGLLLSEGRLVDAQRNAIREAWEERHGGSQKRRRIALLEGGLKYEETGSTHREMEFEKGRAFAWKEELAVLGVPELEVGLTQNINMATAQVISKDFVTKRLVPIMRVLEDGMWAQLFMPAEGSARALLFSEARMVRRRRQAARAAFPNGSRFGRVERRYAEYRVRATEPHSDGSAIGGFGVHRVRPEASLWGEFDLTSIEALREDFGAKLDQAQKAQAMGVPFNQVNDRLDLGFEKLEGDAGETSFISGSLTPIDLKLNPPEPVLPSVDATGKPVKPSLESSPAKEKEEEAEPKKPAKEDEQKKALRARVETFFQRRPLDRERLWMGMIRRTKPIEDKFRSKYRRWLTELREVLLKRLAAVNRPARGTRTTSELNAGQIEHILFDERSAKQRLLSLAHTVYVEASAAGIDSAMTDLGGNFAFDVVDPKVVNAIEARELVLARSTTTLRNRVKRDLEKGVEAGETIHEIQDRLRADFNSFSGARSLMVARTEVAGATNTARNLAFTEEGVESTQWITARDEAVRDTHADIDGDTALIGQPFDNGLMYPGDPAGDAGEVINCRCVAVPVVGRSWKPNSVRKAEAAERTTQRAHELAVAKASAPAITVQAPAPLVLPAPVVEVKTGEVRVTPPAPQVIVNVAPSVAHPTPVRVENVVNVDAKAVETDKDVTYKKDADGDVTGYTIKKAGA